MLTTLKGWFTLPELDMAGLRWSRPASHLQHGVARNGLLYTTEDRIGFQPKGIDARFGARAVSWEFSALSDIELKPTLRKLKVTLVTESGRQRFIVSNAGLVYSDLQAWRRG
ncbi:MAG: hypothetical protein ACLQNG_02365 [Acidimicrobiales bacterium]